jgi:hypothetical protein
MLGLPAQICKQVRCGILIWWISYHPNSLAHTLPARTLTGAVVADGRLLEEAIEDQPALQCTTRCIRLWWLQRVLGIWT